MLILLLVIAAIVVLVLVGGLVIGLALKLLWWALIGLVIGALARLILPGKQAMGWLATAAAGVGGALLGGVIAHAIGVGSILQFVIALAVAVGLVALIGGTERRFA
jgi:uncharacterized membrane protein YeaQ/YmgE (transglycosylase-associated protein family)